MTWPARPSSVFTGLSSFSGTEEHLRAWLFTIAHRRLADDWWRRSRRPEPTECGKEVLQGLAGGDVEEDALARMDSGAVHQICAALPVDQRAVLLLRILAGLPVEQVASVMGRSVAAVGALQRRGLATLRSEIAPETAPPNNRSAMTEGR